MTDNERMKLAQTHYIFPCLVYIQEKIKAGELTEQDLAAVVTRNVEAHGHENYKMPEDWQDQMPHLVNRFGWRIFELPKVVKQQKEEAVLRRLQKKQEKLAKQQEKTVKSAEKALPSNADTAPFQEASTIPPKKKVVVVKRPVQK
ncbi:MAG: hypothetical protein LBD55_02765 [Treponema sp.]|nr:hypothetical protein [Treponema sp.]